MATRATRAPASKYRVPIPIGVAGPWQVDAHGQLMLSTGVGFIDKMDPLQMLAGVEYAAAHTIIGPINDLLADAGQSPLPHLVRSMRC